MTSNFKKSIGIVVLISGVSILGIDYFYTDEFKIENTYVIVVLLLLFFAIYRKIKSTPKTVTIIGAVGLLLLSLYQFFTLLLLGWGYGFLGASIPFIWIVAMIINACLIPLSILEIIQVSKAKQ